MRKALVTWTVRVTDGDDYKTSTEGLLDKSFRADHVVLWQDERALKGIAIPLCDVISISTF